MKLRTQFIASLVIFGAIVLVVAASFVNTEAQISQLNLQIDIAHSIERGTADLDYLSNDYFLYLESQQLDRWQSKLNSIRDSVEFLDPTSSQGLTLANNLGDDMQRLNTVFIEVAAYLKDAPRNVNIRIDPQFQISWRRMAVQTQTLGFDASQLSQVLQAQVDQAQQMNTLLILALFGIFGVYIIANYIIVYRNTLKSIAELQKGTGIIGSGNFNFIIPRKSDDEIGELTHAFNDMTTSLKNVTASKTELEREVSERTRAEEQLIKSNNDLSEMNEELTATEEELRVSNEQVQEYADLLEVRVEERTAELHKAEERLRRVQQVDTVSRIGATVAHDLRGPLNVISQSLEMAEKQPDLTSRMLPTARKSALKALNMIEEFRNGTREAKVVKKNTDLFALVKNVIDGLPKRKKVKIEFDMDEGLGNVPLDPDVMSRVLDNLIRNAMEAIPEAGRVTVSAQRIGDDVAIEVSDTGSGIKPEDAEHLFEPLFTTKAGGMGLGLFSVRTAVEAHGGTISFESKVGIGTTFKIGLPLK